MKLVVTEKNIAAQKIADLLGVGKPKADKVYSTPVYRFERDGEEWVTIGLRGHILEPNFVPALTYKKRGGWIGVDANGEMIPADLPTDLPKPPFKKKKPFVPDGVELNAWKMDALPYLIYAPIEKLPKEKDIIRSLKNLAKKADSIVIATDFDREGELIGSDALTCIREVNEEAPVSRPRAIRKASSSKRWKSWGWVRNRPAIPSSSASIRSSMCRTTRSSLRSSASRPSMRSTSSHRISPVLP